MRRTVLYILFNLFLIENAFSVSINTSLVRNSLDENQYFIEFINVHLTNFLTDEYQALYKSAVELDFEANKDFLTGNYASSYNKLIESQKNLRVLYYKILTERYEKDTEDILQMSTPIILLSRDRKAEYSLRMGFNYLAKAIQVRKYGFGVNKAMLSQKIKFYIDALNYIFKAKRYAIFALIESTIPIMDKSDYKTQTYDEAMKNVEKIDIKVYDYIRNELINNLNKKNLPPSFPFLLHHDDNYNMIYDGKKSVLNEIGDNINAAVKSFKNQKVVDEEKKETTESPRNNTTGGTANPQ